MAQSKIMVNKQTSQYELLNKTNYLSHLGIFQYVRDILQVAVSIDHPVPPMKSYESNGCKV